MKTSTTVKKMIQHPATGKKMRRVFVTGKGWFGWNTIYHVYNSNTNYEQMHLEDTYHIDFTKEVHPVAFKDPQNIHPDMVKMIHGRKGQPTEFVEYRPYNSRKRYAAQKSGDWFHVFEIEAGRGGSVRTLGSFLNAEGAAHQAHDLALQVAQGER